MVVFSPVPFTLDAKGLDLQSTLFCGQSFSWQALDDGRYQGVAGGYAARLTQTNDCIEVQPLTPQADAADFWRRYLALDDDYAALHATFKEDTQLHRCVSYCSGIRVLRQPFFDTLLSFIISQNNNLTRIRQITDRLRARFGEEIAEGIHRFPTAEKLAALHEEDLKELKAGFRARYLIDAAQKVASGSVTEEKLQSLNDDDARKLLCTIVGVGPKVADCVLLFSLGRDAIAPMDVWMKRAVKELFGGALPPQAKGYEGIAQQYIFWYAKNHLE